MRKLNFQEQVFLGFAVAILLVMGIAVTAYLGFKSAAQKTVWVLHSEDAISQTDGIVQAATDADADATWYISTGDDKSNIKNRAIDQVLPKIKRLRDMVSDNVEQVKNVDTLNWYASELVVHLNRMVTVYQAKGLADAKAELLKRKTLDHLERVKAAAGKVRWTEQQLLEARLLESYYSYRRVKIIILIGSFLVFCTVLLLLSYIIRTFQRQKEVEKNVVDANAKLDKLSKEQEEQNWVLQGAVVVDSSMRAADNLQELTKGVILEICQYLKADLGAIYIADANNEFLTLGDTYGFEADDDKRLANPKEGLIGQAVAQQKPIIYNNVPENYIKVSSTLGSIKPKTILVHPIMLRDELKGVVELGFARDIPPNTDKFFEKISNSMSLAIQAGQIRLKTQRLVETTQQQAEELEAQQEELRTTNDELMQKTAELQASEEELRVQQEELRQINSELEEKADLLEERNRAVDEARKAIVVKAEELEQTSKYKSEFLANMSHELRTPLNSILILARILRDNKNANLNDDQVKYANVIHNAGSDLLTLINDILDLSKIESGKLDLNIEQVKFEEVQHDMELLFREVANGKKINFTANIADDVPAAFVSDRLRLEQILKNLLSNSFKFTPENGSISIGIKFANKAQKFFSHNLAGKEQPVVAFSVKDSGIGIPEEKQKVIFEAFQQADGSTSRKYGGTGLGLSISRELSFILGGEIGIESQPGQGSTFTLYLPLSYNEDQLENQGGEDLKPSKVEAVSTGKPVKKLALPKRDKEHVLLIIEDDPNFAEVLKEYAIERGFKPLVAHQGDTGLEMARTHAPDAIVLDIMLPVMDGWEVLRKLKELPETKSIPVHMMSAGDERKIRARHEGAIGFLKKPVDQSKLDEAFNLLIVNGQMQLNKVLIVEDNAVQSEDLKKQLETKNAQCRMARNGEEALSFLQNEIGFDCIILDLSLPDINGLDLLDKIKANEAWAEIPVVINTAMELDQPNLERVMKYTHAMVMKNNKSNDRLLDEVNLFMNKISSDETNNEYRPLKSQPNGMQHAAASEEAFQNKKVLIVDDDMRNIFALTSALQAYDFQISIANNGVEALKKLDEDPETDMVLMDIMMPEMDGYEAMQEIRKQNRFGKLPIIALTAKAMKNDLEKCIEAGANEYISKPVNVEKLVSLMRVWLS